MYLKDGADPDRAIEFLRDRVSVAGNVLVQSGVQPNQVEAARDSYIDWVQQTLSLMSNHTHDPGVTEMLLTSSYWHIRALHSDSARPIPLVQDEIRRQQRNLEWLLEDLVRRRDRAREAPGHIALPDTNVLLNYQPARHIPWPSVIGKEDVRLVLALRVIEELDAKKYTESDRIRQRARELVP